MFEEWKETMNRYAQKHIDRKAFAPIAGELDADIDALSDCYVSVLVENGVVDDFGNPTDADFDQDDLLEAMLERFLSRRSVTDERALDYADLVSAYLDLVEEASEDL